MLLELIASGGGLALYRRRARRRALRHLGAAARPPSAGGTLWRELKGVLTESERERLQEALDPEVAEALRAQRRAERRDLQLSAGGALLAMGASLYPALYIVGAAAVVFIARHAFVRGVAALRQGRIVNVHLVNTLLVVGMVLYGHVFLAALAGFLSRVLIGLLRRTEMRAEQRLVDVFSHQPRRVWVLRDGVELQVPFVTVAAGERVVVNAGEWLPVDGVVEQGEARVDQQILTGEANPVEVGPGEQVFAATLLQSGRLVVRVERAGETSVAAGIGRLLNTSQGYKEQVGQRGERVADRLLPVELGAGALTLGLLGPLPALGVLWSSLGYRMMAFGPLSVLNYLQILSREGILIKDGRVLDRLQRVDTLVFDKTGTLTLEEPELFRLHPLAGWDEARLLTLAAAAEHRQSHPLARAIRAGAERRGLAVGVPEGMEHHLGLGVKVWLEGQCIQLGSARFLRSEGLRPPEALTAHERTVQAEGHTLTYLAVDGRLAGALELRPHLRPEAHGLIRGLRARGIRTYIISGDQQAPTRHIAERLGVDHYLAEVLPGQKAAKVAELRAKGHCVGFVGDGINDTVALKEADLSISLKGAASAATDTAQVVLMSGSLAPIARLFQFGDEFERSMRGNLLFSTLPGGLNIAGIYLLHISLGVSVGIFYLGTLAGMAHVFLPLLHYRSSAPQNPISQNSHNT